jgi:hypothetical protein
MAKAWKEHERRTARRLAGKRTGNTGRATADVEAGNFAIECKSRKALPGWLLDAMAQAQRNAKAGQVAIVALHQVGQRSDNDIICIRLADWLAVAGHGNAWHNADAGGNDADAKATAGDSGAT